MFETVAIVGATGAVGRIMLNLLEERAFSAGRFRLLSSSRSSGTTVSLRGEECLVEELTHDSFEGVDLVLSSTPDDVAAEFLPSAIRAGATVIDESGYWRMDPEVALVVPEINPGAALAATGIIASPNCSTTQMVLALKPLHDASPLQRVIVSTYQATSGAGARGIEDLERGTRAALDGQSYEYRCFDHPIAFNAIPQIGSVKEQGYTSEEIKMVVETRKILDLPELPINATCVRIPVANGHSETITVETERAIDPDEARSLFAEFPGISVLDDTDEGIYPLPAACSGHDDVFIGRIRADLSHPAGLSFWCVSDNLRKGAATNAIQIAELLSENRIEEPA